MHKQNQQNKKKLNDFLTSEAVVRAFQEEMEGNKNKFELVKFVKNLIEQDIKKEKAVDPSRDIKNRSYQMLEDLLRHQVRLSSPTREVEEQDLNELDG